MLRLINTGTKPSRENAAFKHVINLLLIAVIFSYSCMHARLIVLLLSFPFVLKDIILITIINIKNYKGMHMKNSTSRAEEPPQSGSCIPA